jgi:hypothetical protein
VLGEGGDGVDEAANDAVEHGGDGDRRSHYEI